MEKARIAFVLPGPVAPGVRRGLTPGGEGSEEAEAAARPAKKRKQIPLSCVL